MGWLSSKKKKDIDITTSPKLPVECNHMWKDFPWYKDGLYSDANRSVELKIYEPYVCIYCKKRKDIKLDEYYRCNLSFKEAAEAIRDYTKAYDDKILPRAVIEDMVNDEQLVDRQALEIIDTLRGNTTPKHSLRYVKSDGTIVEYEIKE